MPAAERGKRQLSCLLIAALSGRCSGAAPPAVTHDVSVAKLIATSIIRRMRTAIKVGRVSLLSMSSQSRRTKQLQKMNRHTLIPILKMRSPKAGHMRFFSSVANLLEREI